MLAFLQRTVPAPSRRIGVIALIVGAVLTLPAWFISIPLPPGLLAGDAPLEFVITGSDDDVLTGLRRYLVGVLILWLSFALLLMAAIALVGRPLRPLGIVLLAGLVLALPALSAVEDIVTAPLAGTLGTLLPFGVEHLVLPLALACAIGALVACASRDQARDPRRVVIRASLVSAAGTAVLSLLPLFTLLPVAALALALAYAVTRRPQPIAASILRLSSSVSK